ncbi:sensor domain-containing diguanylate cyclase [Vibrio sp. 404]|uniref:diguanylate cyclase n=1 Tax=Vibrio marinisediminis TaxID=2758441 RepID=A0A7W2ITM4_9VIBR|nr:sensor domain-containing diguanylate cyclase [Vibrio marinisediminis]MBA5762640.1 sensor domain-containing diguanylate cyclase [Vibrio marinisediminis]
MIALVKRLTVSQTLFLSHLLLALLIISGMSVARYESEWHRQIRFSAALAKQSLQSQVHMFSTAVSGLNYASMTLTSTVETLSAIDDALFIEVSGRSDHTNRSVVVRYIPKTKMVWRADVENGEMDTSMARIGKLEALLKQVESYNTLESRKLNYLLEKARSEHRLLENSDVMAESYTLDWDKPLDVDEPFFLDDNNYVLHVVLPLRNKNGGLIWAVFDAQELAQFKTALTRSIALQALIALFLALAVVYWVAHWIVNPLNNLASSMGGSASYRSLDAFPELERDDEIGQLARAYRGLLLKIDQQLDSLRAKSDADSLTGLGSRYKYSRTVLPYIERSIHSGQVVGLMICDIDNFKAYNDIYGHMQGDRALVSVANSLQAQLTNVDMAFRYGGEEFVILCYRHDRKELERVSELLRRSVENTNLIHSGNPNYEKITVSIGGALAHVDSLTGEPIDYEQLVESLFTTADRVLYECKRSGRNRSAWASVFSTQIVEVHSATSTK